MLPNLKTHTSKGEKQQSQAVVGTTTPMKWHVAVRPHVYTHTQKLNRTISFQKEVLRGVLWLPRAVGYFHLFCYLRDRHRTESHSSGFPGKGFRETGVFCSNKGKLFFFLRYYFIMEPRTWYIQQASFELTEICLSLLLLLCTGIKSMSYRVAFPGFSFIFLEGGGQCLASFEGSQAPSPASHALRLQACTITPSSKSWFFFFSGDNLFLFCVCLAMHKFTDMNAFACEDQKRT